MAGINFYKLVNRINNGSEIRDAGGGQGAWRGQWSGSRRAGLGAARGACSCGPACWRYALEFYRSCRDGDFGASFIFNLTK